MTNLSNISYDDYLEFEDTLMHSLSCMLDEETTR